MSDAVQPSWDDERELYRSIGEFIYVLSLLEFSIRRAVGAASALGPDIDAVTAPYGLADLCQVAKNVFATRTPFGEDTAKVVQLIEQAGALNAIRKPMVHGTWIQRGAGFASPRSLQPDDYFEPRSVLDTKIAEARGLLVSLEEFLLRLTSGL